MTRGEDGGVPAAGASAEGAPPLPLRVLRPGRVDYRDALVLQDGLVRGRRAGEIPDTLVLLEHAHVLTLGSASDPAHVLVGPEARAELGLDLVETGRGGDVTYHGPGQLVGYPILALEEARRDLHGYLRELEQTLIDALAVLGVVGGREPGLTGVWVRGAKIAALGVRVSSGWITSHGFALNVTTDLTYFRTIVPCGIADRPVTSLERELGRTPSMVAVEEAVAEALALRLGRRLV